jgi:hypothetical protein
MARSKQLVSMNKSVTKPVTKQLAKRLKNDFPLAMMRRLSYSVGIKSVSTKTLKLVQEMAKNKIKHDVPKAMTLLTPKQKKLTLQHYRASVGVPLIGFRD